MQDIEQLKLVLQTIGETTESAKWVILSWFALDLLKLIILFAGIFLLVETIGYLIGSIVASSCFGAECRDMVILDQVGTSISQSEKRRVRQAIQRGLEAEKVEQARPR